MILMLQDIPIMEVDVNIARYKVLREDLLPIRMRGVYHKEFPDLQNRKEYERYTSTFMSFLSHRVLSLSRKNAKKILNAYHFSQSQDEFTKAQIAIVCKAVSMSDDYWLNTDDLKFQWKDICVRKNHLNEIVSNIALTGSSLTVTGRPESPELTTNGAYAKAWQRIGDDVYLLKAGNGENEEKIEVSVSNILDCFDIDHVKYLEHTFTDGNKSFSVSACKVMNSDAYSMIPAEEVYSYCNRTGQDFEAFVLAHDAERFYQTCVVDYLVSNSDRHIQNWGFFMNNKTGVLEMLHPLFDHNNAFDAETIKNPNGAPSQTMLGKTQREAAHIAIRKCEIRCIAPVKRSMFISNEHYESFMNRACELGLYKRKELSFAEKLGLKKCEKYVPVSLKNPKKIVTPIQEVKQENENVQQVSFDTIEQKSKSIGSLSGTEYCSCLDESRAVQSGNANKIIEKKNTERD